MFEPTLMEWFIFVISLIVLVVLVGLWIYGTREPRSKPSDYTIKRSNPSGMRFGLSFVIFIQTLIGGSIFLLIIYVADLYPRRELITFGFPLLFAFAMGVGFASKK